MAEKVKNHYVPKTHLKWFATFDKLTNSFVISDNKFLRNIPYEDQCQKRYFYGKDTKIEDAFGDLETKVAAILSELNSDAGFNLSEEEQVNLRFYIHTLSCRTLKEEEYTNQNIRSILQYPLEKEAGYSKSESVEIMENAKIKSINMVIGACVKTFDLTLDLSITLLKNNTQLGFVLSDNPVVKSNYIFNENNSTFNGYGFAAKGLIITMPISPKFCVILYDKESYRSMKLVTEINKENNVKIINSLQFLNSHKTLYFKNVKDERKLQKIFANVDKPNRMIIKERFDKEGSKFVYRETEGYTSNHMFSFIKLINKSYKSNLQLTTACPRREEVKPILLNRYGPSALL